jgi:hypothetical protein
VSDLPTLSQDDDRLVKQFMSQFDAPAYMRRARRVQEAFDDLVAACRQQRQAWLSLVRIRLGIVYALARDEPVLRTLLADDQQLAILHELHATLDPRLRVPVEPTSSPRLFKRALRELRESIERFNQRWQDYLSKLNLSAVNEEREGYNRYYVLEKECAVRSAAAARQGFRRLEPLTIEQLTALLPGLPVPQIA